MALKPIGSEKLKGQDKINRIMEIANYGTVEKNTTNHVETTSFLKEGKDGNFYGIIQEKDGYHIKSGLNESDLDYVGGIRNKNKNRFKSYSAALKRLNLMFKPINEQYNEGVGDTMYGKSEIEDQEEKFTLKTPEAPADDEDMDMDDDMDMDMDDDMDMEDDMDMDMEDEDMGMEDDMEMGDEEGEEEMEGVMKSIQKLTGKLGQKLRDGEEDLDSEDIKYVINSVLSAVDLDKLEDEDKEDIVSRFEEDETEYGDEELEGGDVDLESDEFGAEDDMEMDDEDMDMDMEDEDMDMEEEVAEDEGDEDETIADSVRKRKNIISEQFFGLSKIIKGIKSLIKKGDELTKEQLETLKAIIAIPLVLLSPFGVTASMLRTWKGIAKASGVVKAVKSSPEEPKEQNEGVVMEALKKRVSNLLESYVEEKKDPSKYLDSVKKIANKNRLVEKHSSSVDQELSAKKFIKENNATPKGLTKSGAIIMISEGKKVYIDKKGSIR